MLVLIYGFVYRISVLKAYMYDIIVQFNDILLTIHSIPQAAFVHFLINTFANENLYRFLFHIRFIRTYRIQYTSIIYATPKVVVNINEVCLLNRCLFHVSTPMYI